MPAVLKKVTKPKERKNSKPVQAKYKRVFNDLEMILFKNLRLLREESGHTQSVWAEKIGVGLNYVRAYEAGRYIPSYGVLVLIANHAEVSLDWLFGRSKVRRVQ